MAVFAAASRKLPDGAPGGTNACFAAIDAAIATALAVERNAEREACAKVPEAEGAREPAGWGGGPADVAAGIAAAIRARK